VTNSRLNNKTVVISGGTKGIGASLVKACAKQGANVVFGGRDKNAADNILLELDRADKERVNFLHTDLRSVKGARELFKSTVKEYGRIDGFVNYAGVTPVSGITECDEDTFDCAFDINTRAAFFCVQEAIKSMQRNGGGSIVLVGTAHAWCGERDRAAYAMSKGAILTLSEHIARHYAAEQIRCNLITMGWTPTEGEIALRKSQGMTEQELHQTASSVIPMGRMLTEQDHIPAFLYLLSDDSAMVTGSNIRVTGGEYI